MRVAGLLGANALMLVAGLGVLPLLGVASSWRGLVFRSGLAYLWGLLLVGIVSAHLALVQVSFGWIGLVVVAALSLAFCAWRLSGTERPGWRRPGWIDPVGFAALVALIVDYGRAFRVAPLNRYDAWAIWALKGHALYAFGWADPVVFAGASYRFANLDYPLLLPSLEAIGFRAMGAFDTGSCTCSSCSSWSPRCWRSTRCCAIVYLLSCSGSRSSSSRWRRRFRPVAHRVCRSPAGAGVRRRRRSSRPVGGHERTLGTRACDVLLCRRIADEERGLAVRSRSLSPGSWPLPTPAGARSQSRRRLSTCSCFPGASTSASTIFGTSTTASETASTSGMCMADSASGRSRSGHSPARCSIPRNGGC